MADCLIDKVGRRCDQPRSILGLAKGRFARLAPFAAFRYSTATRVDTLGGNADEGREFAAFDIFGARAWAQAGNAPVTRKEKP
jgi:hypothetical protein